MLALTNPAEQTIAPGATVTFTTAALTGVCSCGETFNALQNSIRLNRNAVYDVTFEANITGATAATPVQLAITVDGTAVPTGTAIYTPAAANAVGSISRTIPVANFCEATHITVTNNGTEAVIVSANPLLYVRQH